MSAPPVERPAPPGRAVAGAPAPDAAIVAQPLAQPDVVALLVDSAADGVRRAVNPAAAAQVATTFRFPLSLMLAVILFLVVQDQVDRRDPKLRAAPRTVFDTFVRFRDEAEV
jgi:hypothetical protein